MKRLTFKDGRGCNTLMINGQEYHGPIADRLAAYEDTGLEPEELDAMQHVMDIFTAKDEKQAKRLFELAGAEAEDRLIVLPFKVGGKVFRASWPSGDRVTEIKINRRGYHFKCWWGWFHKKDIGKTIFLTCEEAAGTEEGAPT